MVALNKTYRKTLTPDRSAKDSGLRFYSPEISRWLNRDPIGEEGGLNLYGFVENGAIRRSDPLGQKKGCYCCCAEKMKVIYAFAKEQYWWHFPAPLDGHWFKVGLKLRYKKDVSAKKIKGLRDCRFEWREKTDKPPTGSGLPKDKWYDVVTKAPNADPVKKWFERKKKCPGTEYVFMLDKPGRWTGTGTSSRYVNFAIRVTSATDCGCTEDSLRILAWQKLKHVGGAIQWESSSFSYMNPGETTPTPVPDP
jgi:RHS repeat-associated protein